MYSFDILQIFSFNDDEEDDVKISQQRYVHVCKEIW